MLWYKKTIVICYLIIGVTILPFATLASTVDADKNEVKNGPEVMTVDVLLVRPLGLVATVLGSVVFLVASPFSALGGNTQETWDTLVVEPAKFTFQRPLGHFEGDK